MSEISFYQNSFLSADGHTRVQYYVWAPSKSPRGIIQISHGMCEYIARYEDWARRFAEAGFIVCGNDHLGHGKTAPDEEELGYTAPRRGADFLVEDVHTLSQLMKTEHEDLPLILYGHSMGSFVAREYLTRYGDGLAAAVISGTAGPGAPTGIAKMLAHFIAKVKGNHHRSKLLLKLSMGDNNKRFKEEKSSQSWLTRDPELREKYKEDPLCRFIFTTAGYETLFSLLHAVSRRDWAKKVPKTLPVLLLSGDMDPVGNYGKGVRKVYERLLKAGCERVTLKLYPDARHEPHNEINRDEVFSDLIAYFEEVLV